MATCPRPCPIQRVKLEVGELVLDVGCGVGAFLRLVADRGARAFGIDASPALAEVARERVPGAELRVGDMEALPSDDDTFDLVTGFNSFFFEAIKELVRPFMPQRPADAPPEPDYSKPGVLEEIALQAGLEPERAFDTTWAYEYPDGETLRRALVAPAGIAVLVGADHEEAVKDAIRALLIVSAGDEAKIRSRLADDPWTRADRLVIASIESWKIMTGAERLSSTPAPRGSGEAAALAAAR